MSEDDKLQRIEEADFNPLVVIVANDAHHYASFEETIVKGGFKCSVYDELPEEMIENPARGTIFFVSFNLKTYDASLLARRIEQKGNLCIVFAEQQGVETAAKLSSAKMTQTLQHPYTEKNFLMAVQTIVKKRRVQYEKDLRKQSHLDRRKVVELASEVDHASKSRIFKGEERPVDPRSPLIFEERLLGKKFSAVIEGRGVFPSHAHFRQDRRRRGLMEIQKGLANAKFMMMPSESADAGGVIVSSAGEKGGFGTVQSQPESPLLKTTQAKASSVEVNAVTSAGAAAKELKATEASLKSASSKSGKQNESMGERGEEDPPPEASTRAKREGEVLVGYTKEDLLDGRRANLLVGQASSDDPQGEKRKREPSEVSPLAEVTKIAGPIVVPTWALIAAASIGILFILFFLYQMMFHRH